MSPNETDGALNAGFTLLELLVTLALMATIGTTMAVAVGQLRPMQAFQERLDENIAASTVADAIARDVQAALRLSLIEGGGTSAAMLRGEQQGIVFSAVVPTGYRRLGVREVAYRLKRSEVETSLTRSIRLRRFTQGNEKEQVDEVYAGSFDLRFKYLARQADGQRAWLDAFGEPNVLPMAVLIELSLKCESGQVQRRIVRLTSD